MSDVAVLLPAYNEELTIGLTIDDVKAWVPDAEIIVIDNNCTDKTARIAEEAGVTVIPTPRSMQGKGYAMRWGFGSFNFDYYIMIDSDYTYPAKHIPDILRLLEHRADVVMGYRQWQAKGAISRANKLGNWGLTKIASIIYRYPVHDLCTGMWGFRREAIDNFILLSAGFTLEAELFLESLRTGCRIEQMPIEYRARFYDSDSKLRVWTGLKIGRFLVKRRFRAR